MKVLEISHKSMRAGTINCESTLPGLIGSVTFAEIQIRVNEDWNSYQHKSTEPQLSDKSQSAPFSIMADKWYTSCLALILAHHLNHVFVLACVSANILLPFLDLQLPNEFLRCNSQLLLSVILPLGTPHYHQMALHGLCNKSSIMDQVHCKLLTFKVAGCSGLGFSISSNQAL